jgi:Fe-S-cluster-containing dehydrogenase component
VALSPNLHRGGFLTMAGVLKVSANGTNTSTNYKIAAAMRFSQMSITLKPLGQPRRCKLEIANALIERCRRCLTMLPSAGKKDTACVRLCHLKWLRMGRKMQRKKEFVFKATAVRHRCRPGSTGKI